MERISFSDLPAGLFNGMFQSQAFIDHSGIDKKILYLVKLRASIINSCAYCIDMHYKDAILDGETPIRLLSLSAWRETNYYTPVEQAVLEFTEKLTKAEPDVHTHDILDSVSKYFDKHQIAIITLAVAQINAWNRITRSFGTTAGTYQPKERAAAN